MSNELPALPAATTPVRAAAVNVPAKRSSGVPELPQVLEPALTTAPAFRDGLQAADSKFLEFEHVGIPIPDAAPSWAHDGGPDASAGTPNGEFAWKQRSDPQPGPRRKAAAGASPRARQRLRATVLTSALLAVLALGWIGGSATQRLLHPNPSPSMLKQRSTASARADSGPSREASAPAPSVRKFATPATTRPEPAPVALQSGLQNLPRLVPVPETRPTTIEGWTVRDVAGSVAVLEGPNGIWRAARGDIVPGVGRVDSIVRWGHYWLVATSRGLIASD
jgi:hypothetical protein